MWTSSPRVLAQEGLIVCHVQGMALDAAQQTNFAVAPLTFEKLNAEDVVFGVPPSAAQSSW